MTITDEKVTDEVVLAFGEGRLLVGESLKSLSDDAKKSAKALLSLTPIDSGIYVKPRGSHIVGRVRVGKYLVTVLPRLSSQDFTTLFVFSHGLNQEKIHDKPTGPVSVDRHRDDFFGRFLAELMGSYSSAILRRNVSQSYLQKTDRTHLVRGRPRWVGSFGRHPATGVTCTYYEKTTDNLLNQLVLAGIDRARQILASSTATSGHIEAQFFTWRSVASYYLPSYEDFDRALAGLTRLTAHYEAAIRLSRLLWFGFDPANIFRRAEFEIPLVAIDLSRLFHNLLYRLLKDTVPTDVEVLYEKAQNRSLVDGKTEKYQRIEPDLVLMRGGKAVALIDAKFKPQYVEATPLGRPISKVSPEDVYQLLFYQARLRRIHDLDALFTAIAAPRIAGVAVTKHHRLTVSVGGNSQAVDPSVAGFKILEVPLPAMLGELRKGGSSTDVLAMAPRLASFVGAAVGK